MSAAASAAYREPVAPPCGQPDCVALAIDGSAYCSAHAMVTVRGADEVPIHCITCGTLIAKGQRWVVRAEGAHHARVRCLLAPAEPPAVVK